MKLDFIIIGGQKCGSTYLHSVLNHHPEIDMVKMECPHFETPDYENHGLDELVALLNSLNQNKLNGIKRPNYLCKPEVPERIKKVNKNIKLITILRNPVERLKSAYFHYMNHGFCPVLSLDEGIERIIKGSSQIKYPRSTEILEFGFYAKYLKNYIKEFDKNLLVLTYDDLKKDEISVIKKCYSFLNVDANFVPPNEVLYSRPQKVNYSLFRTWLLTKKNKFLFKYNHDRTRLTYKEKSLLDKIICSNIDRIDKYVVKKITESNEKPKFSKKIHKQIFDIYISDIEELEELLHLDLSSWKNNIIV